jgi:hypothetical protein
MRGNQAFTSLFPTGIEPKPDQKGQRNVHLDRRDDALALRFYYYHHFERVRYDDILLKLEIEFFITPNVIAQRLNTRTDYMKELSRTQPKVTDLRKLLPFFHWN